MRVVWISAVAIVLAAIVIVWIAADQFSPQSTTGSQGERTPAVVAKPDGKSLYMTHCASCHGVKLEGQPNWRQRKADGRLPAPPHDATGHTWHHSDAHLILVTLKGPQAVAGPSYQSDMPAYEGQLSETQVRAILTYIKSFWPKEIREHQNRLQ